MKEFLAEYRAVTSTNFGGIRPGLYIELLEGKKCERTIMLLGTEDEMNYLNTQLYAAGSNWLISGWMEGTFDELNHTPVCILIASDEALIHCLSLETEALVRGNYDELDTSWSIIRRNNLRRPHRFKDLENVWFSR